MSFYSILTPFSSTGVYSDYTSSFHLRHRQLCNDISRMRRYDQNILQWRKTKSKCKNSTQWRLLVPRTRPPGASPGGSGLVTSRTSVQTSGRLGSILWRPRPAQNRADPDAGGIGQRTAVMLDLL